MMGLLLIAFFVYRLITGEYTFVPFAAIFLYLVGVCIWSAQKSLRELRHD